MSLLFKAMYAVGFTPWDRTDAIPGDGDQVLDTVATVETGDPPYGRALDIGCGKGRYSIALALRGWQVTGIDAVHKAVMMARERTSRHGAEVRYVEADATRLAAEVPPGFRLVFDGGFFHTLSDEQRSQVVRQENAVTDADATLAMVAFQPVKGPGPRGITPEDVQSHYAGWTLVDVAALDVGHAPKQVRRAAPQLYLLRKG